VVINAAKLDASPHLFKVEDFARVPYKVKLISAASDFCFIHQGISGTNIKVKVEGPLGSVRLSHVHRSQASDSSRHFLQRNGFTLV
jgi:hypothetical protein